MTDKTDRPVPELTNGYRTICFGPKGTVFYNADGTIDTEAHRAFDEWIEKSRIEELKRIQAKFERSRWAA